MQAVEKNLLRTHWSNNLSKENIGEKVTLAGWVSTVRDLGGVIFIELRDRSGLFQLVSDPTKNPEVHAIFSQLKTEYVVSAKGIVLSLIHI